MSQTLIFRATTAFITIVCIAGSTFATGEAATVAQSIKTLSQEKIYEMDGDTPVLAREIQSRILSVKPQSQPSAPIQPMEILRKHDVENFANALTGEQKTVN